MSPFSESESLVVQTEGGQEMPRGKKFTKEQIIGKRREAEVGLAKGKTLPEVVWRLGGPQAHWRNPSILLTCPHEWNQCLSPG
jgi:hypothetical protein